jgi:transposase
MAMGKRPRHAKQTLAWIATQDLPRSAAHPFYTGLTQFLDTHNFDTYVEGVCQRFYADDIGRPGLPPGRHFRLLMIGYFEGLDAERAIGWRAADSFALREVFGLVLPEAPPDHSTISRTRRSTSKPQEAAFTWILHRLADAGLVKDKTVGIDAATLEANAALRSIVRRDTGEDYHDHAGAGVGDRDADARRPRAHRSEPGQERVERRLDASVSSRRQDREDERRPHASRPPGRAYGKP